MTGSDGYGRDLRAASEGQPGMKCALSKSDKTTFLGTARGRIIRVLLAVVAIATGSVSAHADYKKECDDKTNNEIAIKGCSELIRRDARDAAAYYNRAMAYYNAEDIDRAIADYTKVEYNKI